MKILTLIACLLCSTVMAQTGLYNTARIPDPKKKVVAQVKPAVPIPVHVAPAGPVKFTLTFNEAELNSIYWYLINSKNLLPFIAKDGVKPIEVTNMLISIDTIPAYIEKKFKAFQADTIKKTK